MKENKIKAILVIVILVILFVLSSFSLYYLDNLVIQLICWIYVILFLSTILFNAIIFIGDAIFELSEWLKYNLK